MPPDIFDTGPVPVFVRQIFIEEKPGDYRFANVVRALTDEECFAEYGGLFRASLELLVRGIKPKCPVISPGWARRAIRVMV